MFNFRTVCSVLSALVLGHLLFITSIVSAQQSSAGSDIASAKHKATVQQYCVTCHNETLKTAGLMLDLADISHPAANPAVWAKLIRKLRTRAMPPASMPRPDDKTYKSLVSYLESSLDEAASQNPDPGRLAAFHRLNRAEYTNAIRDLLAVEFDGQSLLPDDNAEQGFDNVGSALTVSPVLMESYLVVAEKVSGLALGNGSVGSDSATYKVADEAIQDERMSEDLPFGSRGGMAVRHNFSLDGEYEIFVKLVRNSDGWIRGLLDMKHPLEIRIDGKLVKRFEVGGESKGKTGPIHSRIGGTEYRFDEKQMEYEFFGDAGLKVRFPAQAGNHLVQIYFLKRNYAEEGLHEYYEPRTMLQDIRDFKGGEPALSEFTIAGPFNASGPGNTASRQKILLCKPAQKSDERTCAEKILTALAHRAYRRPVGAADIAPLMKLYETAGATEGFETGLTRAIEGILVSPGFLFRMERDPAGVVAGQLYPVPDIDLASRLSFFLWSSIPDDELLELAEQGTLHEPAVIQAQVHRMLSDPRSASLTANFAAQWLYLRNLPSHRPDNRLYPDYDEELRTALQQETELFLLDMVREDRPVIELINADYTFLNQRLADHYGIKGVYGSHFRKVSLAGQSRQGLLGQGSILTLTSRPNRTSPVIRGKWVLENLLGSPPPPPPPNVPALNEKTNPDKPMTLRQRMEQHRNNPVCATCHTQMEPYGFALDNFDPVGAWRADDNGAPIDAKAVLPDKTEFEGPDGVRNVLKLRQDTIIHNFTEKLLVYALGRGIRPQDQPFVREILREAESGNYVWSSIITGIVNSTPFKMRRSESL